MKKLMGNKVKILVLSILFTGIFGTFVLAESETDQKRIDLNINVKESISMMVTPEESYNDGKNNVVLDMEAAMYQEVQANIKAATNSLAGLVVVVNDVDEDTNLNHEDTDDLIPTSTNIAVGNSAWGIKATLPGSTEESYSSIPKRSERGLTLLYTEEPTPSGEYDETDIAFAFSTSYTQPAGVYKDVVVFTATTNASAPAIDGKYALVFNTGIDTKIPTTTKTIGEPIDLSAISEQLTKKGFFIEYYRDQRGNQYERDAVVDVNQGGLSAVILTVQWEEVDFFSNITTMQEMTAEICAKETKPNITATMVDSRGEHYGNPNYVPEITLTDVRDGSTYVIRKLADGNCWMTQNLGLVGPMELTTESSDVLTNGFQLPAPTNTGFDAKNTQESNAVRKISATYGGGAYYTFVAATAGAGTQSLVSADSPTSVCPKGWMLPPTKGNKSHASLIKTVYGLGNNSDSAKRLHAIPFEFTNHGYISSNSISGTGSYGYYHTSTAYSHVNLSYSILISNTGYTIPKDDNRFFGEAIRCVAR